MKLHKKMLNIIIGLVLIVAGLALSIDFIVKFATAAIGLILLIVGISLLTRKL
ncbi:MAG: hypothetical protein R6U32_07290 [Candidatus Woesearchaeota archaeon]